MKYFATALAMVVMTASCAAAGSQQWNAAGLNLRNPGDVYRLPMAIATIQAKVGGGQIAATMSFDITGDPTTAYYISLEDRAFTDNALTVATDPTGLLTKVEINSDAQISEALENLVAVPARGHNATEDNVVATVEIDPIRFLRDDNDFTTDPLNELNGAVWTSIEAALRRPACELSARPSDATQAGFYDECVSYRALKASVCANPCTAALALRPALIRVRLNAAPGGVNVDPAVLTRDCTQGVCYREPAPYTATIWTAGTFKQSLILIPNGQPPVTLPLENAVFANRHTTITFVDGMPGEVMDDHDSEAAAFASLPLRLVSTVIDAAAAPLGFRSAELGREQAYLQAQTQLLQARAALEAECLKLGDQCRRASTAPPPIESSAGEPQE